MDVFLLRASLTGEGTPGIAEAHRFLSAEGRQVVRALGNRVRLNEEPSFDRMVVSPFACAIQTAELFADRVDYVGVIEVMPSLTSGVPPEVIAPLLLSAPGKSVVVVADEPALSSLGAFLIGRPTFPPLQKGQLSVIQDRQPAWCMRPGELARSLLLVA